MNRIVPIFAAETEAIGLYSMHYDSYPLCEFDRFLRSYGDPDYILSKVSSFSVQLEGKPYKLTKASASVQIEHEFAQLTEVMLPLPGESAGEFVERFGNCLQPLYKSDFNGLLKKGKAAQPTHTLLRLYAAQIDTHLVLLTGWEIKTTRKMDQDPALQQQLDRMETIESLFNAGLLSTNHFTNRAIELPDFTTL